MTRSLKARSARTLAALAAFAIALALLSQSAAAAGSGPDVREVARQLAAQAAAPWPDLQRQDGSFRDDIRHPTPYGESILGYALLGTGLREHDDRLIGAAMKAFGWVIEHRSKRFRPSTFQNWSMAASYEMARRAIPDDPRFKGLLPGFRRLLRHQVLRRLKLSRHYGNHQLVEALEVLELERTGLRSTMRKSALGPRRREYLARAMTLLNKRIPGLAKSHTVNVGSNRTFILSDPPDQPLAYQGLSLGMYARALQLLGGRAGGVTPGVLRRVAEASWRLSAPDGDLGYMGRNNEEAWILAATAFGAHQAAVLPGTPAGRRARFEGVSARALARLVAVHMGGPDGLYIIPALRENFDAAKQAVDLSGGSAEFAGLTLVYLNLLADSPARGPAPDGVAADGDGISLLGRGPSLRAAVRHGDVWYATRAVLSAMHPGDLRYDSGLIVLKHRASDGSWRDVIPARPRVPLNSPADGAGPLLRTAHGRAILAAARIEPRPGGALELVGAYRRLGSGAAVGRAGAARIDPLRCGGAQVSFSARKGDRVEYSVFLRDGGGGPVVGPDSVSSGGTRVTFTPGAQVSIVRGLVSATAPFVARARLRWRADRGRLFRVGICDGG